MPVIIDVSNLGYIDSSAFRAIYQASEHIAISIVVSPGSVLSRTIRLAGISSKIPIFPDVDTASIRGQGLLRCDHDSPPGPDPWTVSVTARGA
jgi:anti-anti-sigma regulatory factor